MIMREVGKTGKMASAIGLGCEHLDKKPYEQVKDVIDAAIDGGVNIFDVFMPGREVRTHIRSALGNRRDKVMIQGHIGSTDVNQQYDISRDMPVVKKYFEEMLTLYDGYIDFGMLFFIDSEADFKGAFEGGLADYALKLKSQGKIGHIGFSSHNPVMARRAIETGVPEMMLFSINPAFDACPMEVNALEQLDKGFKPELYHGVDPERSALYTLCQQKGIGITVMKTLGAGKLMSAEHSPFKKPFTSTQLIHYSLTRPAVSSVLLGCKSREELSDALRYYSASDEERDYTEPLLSMQNDFEGHCMYCSHCQPCPAEIDIASVNKYLDIAMLNESDIPPSIRAHYRSLKKGGDQCIQCGQCEERCPFNVKVIDAMNKAAEIFA